MGNKYVARVERFNDGQSEEVQFGRLSESAPPRRTLYLSEGDEDFGKYKAGEEYIFEPDEEKPKKATRVRAGKKAAKKKKVDEAAEANKKAGEALARVGVSPSDAVQDAATALSDTTAALSADDAG